MKKTKTRKSQAIRTLTSTFHAREVRGGVVEDNVLIFDRDEAAFVIEDNLIDF